MPSRETTDAILNIFKTFCNVYGQFCKEIFEDQSKPISDTISKARLPPSKILASVPKQAKATAKQNKDCQRVIDLARERGYSIQSLLSYELTRGNYLFEKIF